ncbi:MAG: hypothetical protein PSX81_01185 [bacterium]|nr:hypothetical protein [bacterium]
MTKRPGIIYLSVLLMILSFQISVFGQHNMLINLAYSNFGFSKPMLGVYGEVTIRTRGFEALASIPYYDYSTDEAKDLKDNTDHLKKFRHFRFGLTSSLWSGNTTQKFFQITGPGGFVKDGAGNYQGSDGQRYSYYVEGYSSFQDAKAKIIMSFGVDYMRTTARPNIERDYTYSNVSTTSGYCRFFYGKSSSLYSQGYYIDMMYAPFISFSSPIVGGITYPIYQSGNFKNRPLGLKVGYEFYSKYFSTVAELGTVPGVSKNRFIANISIGFPFKF